MRALFLTCRCFCTNPLPRPVWRNGRRKGLKIPYPVRGVRVRVPPPARLHLLLPRGKRYTFFSSFLINGVGGGCCRFLLTVNVRREWDSNPRRTYYAPSRFSRPVHSATLPSLHSLFILLVVSEDTTAYATCISVS